MTTMSSDHPGGRYHSQMSMESLSGLDLPQIPTTLSVQVPEDRDYSSVLSQTEIVYDQLLAEKYHKMVEQINARTREFENKVTELTKAGDQAKALEFKRWADVALAQLKSSSAKELVSLREDYERKYLKLWQNLESQWQAQLNGPQF